MCDPVFDAVAASPARSWFDNTVNVGASMSRSDPAHLSDLAQRAVSFAEESSVDDEDRASVVSDKSLHLEGLFGASVSKPASGDVPTALFHRVAELIPESRQKFQANLESGKLPASGLPSRRIPRSCEEPMLRSANPFKSSLFRLVGILSSKRSHCFSFDEAAKVESLAKGLLDSHSISFWLFSAFLHWLKELGFVPPDPTLFEQLVQVLSLSLVGSVSSAALATYFQAKRWEGVLNHFCAHVGLHFRRDLASSSFSGPDLFNEEVLARVIAASREDTHLDAQLSLAKVFSLPVFRGARSSDRKASSGQNSAAASSPVSASRSRGRGSSESWNGKRKASSSTGRGCFSKSPRRGTLPSSKRLGFRK